MAGKPNAVCDGDSGTILEIEREAVPRTLPFPVLGCFFVIIPGPVGSDPRGQTITYIARGIGSEHLSAYTL